MASNLAEFVAAEESAAPRRPKCFTCNLPDEVLDQVEDARAQAEPVFYSIISKWLKSEGHEVTIYNLRNHFQAEHHKDVR